MSADMKEENAVFFMLMGQAMNNGMLMVSPKETIRKDCSYYLEVQDMSAHVPSCILYEGICNCRCENCTRYASKMEEI